MAKSKAITQHQLEQLIWNTMTPQQVELALRITARLESDYAFSIRLGRERQLVRQLFWNKEFAALEDWLAKRTLEVVR